MPQAEGMAHRPEVLDLKCQGPAISSSLERLQKKWLLGFVWIGQSVAVLMLAGGPGSVDKYGSE
jgi:hypothetical protein